MTDKQKSLAEILSQGVKELGLALSSPSQELLLSYLEQLHKWNKAYNLSGIKEKQEMLTLHILDSLALAPFVDSAELADVGTGAGLPGMPLAICFPEKKFFLVDSNSKKTRFIFQTAAMLGLQNVEVVHSRIQDYERNPQVAIVTSRAFASLKDFVTSCSHLVAQDGKFLAMKGQIPENEIAELPSTFHVTACHPLALPGTSVARHVLEIRKK